MRVTPPNLGWWLTSHVRALAAAEGLDVDVDESEPDDLELPLARPLIVIRDDSGPRLDWSTFDRSVGVSVLGGSKTYPKPARDLALWASAVLFDNAIADAAGSPIAVVVWDGCNGPYAVLEELDVARMYLTAQYTVVGS